jgi:toxin ParE1/3/4
MSSAVARPLGPRLDELRQFPFLGPDRSELRASLRGLLIDGYIAFYTVEADQMRCR